MVKRIISVYTLILPVVFFISSCATTYTNEKLIVGGWKTIHAEAYNEKGINKSGTKPAATQQAKSGPSTIKPVTNPPKEQPGKDDRLTRMIQTEIRSTLSVYDNKTFEKTYEGKVTKGTWKLQKKGTRIIARNNETSKKTMMDILSISDTTATVVETTDFGKIKINYIKRKSRP